jgi:hypothetical protein
MNLIPNDLLSMILQYCDNFKDYRNWSLVSRRWNKFIKAGIRNILNVILNDEINNLNGPSNVLSSPFDRMYSSIYPKTANFYDQIVRHFYESPGDEIIIHPMVEPGKCINSLHFIWWPNNKKSLDKPAFNIIVHFYTKGVLMSTIDVSGWRDMHPYSFGSNLLKHKSVGFICTKYLMKDVETFDRIVFKNTSNLPFLILYQIK